MSEDERQQLMRDLVAALRLAEQADTHMCERCLGEFGACDRAVSLAHRAREARRAVLRQMEG